MRPTTLRGLRSAQSQLQYSVQKRKPLNGSSPTCGKVTMASNWVLREVGATPNGPSAMGGVFDVSSIPIASMSNGGAPEREVDMKNLKPEDLLPHTAVLSKLYEEKRVSIPPETQLEVVGKVLNFVQLRQRQGSDQLAKSIIPLTGGDLRNLTALGTMLARHSPEGAPFARLILEIAAGKGEMDAEFQLAQLLVEDLPGSPKNPSKALQLLASLAGRNHPASQYNLGRRYVSTGSDIKGGLILLKKAAENGMAQACAQLGHIYSQGIGRAVPKDIPKARKYLEQAHEKGLIEATFLIGALYASGEIPSGDQSPNAKAHEFYTIAANKGLSIAQHNLGSLYFEGDENNGIKRDVRRAIEYWKMAAEQGLQLSQLNMGKLYMDGLDGSSLNRIRKDYVLAERYLQDCVKTGGEVGENAQTLLAELADKKRAKGDGRGCQIM
ncbi:hypothetical protein DFJ77DRAFT_451331 [Powellomyces hirtus]|nr:hypothetical protein DFJ77DRAFT_451331 [Powellomyces hirtus]